MPLSTSAHAFVMMLSVFIGSVCSIPSSSTIAVNQLFDILINVSNGSLQVLHQSNPRSRGLMVMLVCVFHFSFWVALSQVLRMSGGHQLVSVCLDLLTSCKILCICFLSWCCSVALVSVVVLENLWGFVSSECIPRYSVSNELFPLCLAVFTHINNPVLRGHRPHPPELIGVFACEGLIQLTLNLREVFPEAVLKILISSFVGDLWFIVPSRSLLLCFSSAVRCMHNCLSLCQSKLLGFLATKKKSGREISRAHLKTMGLWTSKGA